MERIVSRTPPRLNRHPAGRAGCGGIRDNDRMRIHLNGKPFDLPAASTVAQLLLQQGLAERRVAVEVNGAIVPRGAHATRQLLEGDRLEIVHELGGG
jgi:sulfur carrier protein